MENFKVMQLCIGMFFLDRFRSVTGFSQATARYEPRFGTGNTRFSSSRKKFRAAMRRTMLDVFALRLPKEIKQTTGTSVYF